MVAEADEGLEKTVLNAVSDSIGLLVDADAIAGPAGGRRWFKGDWKSKDGAGETRIRPPSSYVRVVDGQASRVRRHTGILLQGDEDANGVVYVATAAHCVSLHRRELDEIRLVVGRREMDGVFDERHVVELGVVKHYEDMPDRDLVVLAAKGTGEGLQPMSLPRDSLAPEVASGDEPVYVVGHPGGRGLSVLSGRVKSVVGPAHKPRGLNIVVPGARYCLSGAPVFRWTEERRAAIMLGVVQGNKSIERRLYALLREFTNGDDAAFHRLVGDVHDAVHYAELLRLHGAVDTGMAAALRRSCDACGVPNALLPWRGVTWGSLLSSGFVTEKLQASLRRHLTDSQARELERAMREPDECDVLPDGDKLNVTLVHGGPSIDLASGP